MRKVSRLLNKDVSGYCCKL